MPTDMPTHPPSDMPLRRRWLVAALTAVLFGGVVAVGAVKPGPVDARTPPSRTDPVGTISPTTPPPTTWPSATGPTPVGDSIRFFGRGYGHGVGLNQYGARGRALAGQQADHILGHYFRDAELGSIPTSTAIRVRLFGSLAASSSRPFVLIGRRGGWRIDGVSTVFPADARLEARPTISGSTASWRVRVISAAGSVLRDAAIRTFRVRGASSATVFEVDAKPSSADTYRGDLRVGLSTSSARVSVTNETTLELYLRGVVPAEMPSTWPAEALRAQSIAARSYAARRLRPGVSYFDVPDDASSQVYLGLKGERSGTTAAVTGTAGVVLRSGTAIANAMFHSTGGGSTEHNENVYVSSTGAIVAGPVSYLRGGPDRRADGTAWDAAAPFATWSTTTYSRAALSAVFGADSRTDVGTLTALDLRDRGVGGRLRSVTLIGSSGTKRVSGDVFRAVFNARRPSGDPMVRSTLLDTAPIP